MYVFALFFIFLIGYIRGFSDDEDYPVTCGTLLKLQNKNSEIRLHSHDIKYGSGSGQQSVTGMSETGDVNSHWQILGRMFIFFRDYTLTLKEQAPKI